MTGGATSTSSSLESTSFASTIYSTGTSNTTQEQGYVYEYQGLFGTWATIYLAIAFVAIGGNGMVLYATKGNRNTGRLQSLDSLIKSLALTDMLLGLFGIPCRILNSYLLGR